MSPFSRISATARAEMRREDAAWWDEQAEARERKVDKCTGRDREDAIAHAQIARRYAAFNREIAEAYERVARGLPAFEDAEGDER